MRCTIVLFALHEDFGELLRYKITEWREGKGGNVSTD